MPQLSTHTPVGDIAISDEKEKIISIDWGWGRDQDSSPVLREAKKQLDAYFDGKLTKFNLPLLLLGTDFQKRLCRIMLKIPYGKTATYGDLAKQLKSAPRAVGVACRRNPISIFVPCHRVVGSGRWMGGYSGAGGLDTKTALLRLEGALTRENLKLPLE